MGSQTVEEFIIAVDAAVQARGLPQMDEDTLRETTRRVMHPDVMRAIQSGQITPDWIADEAANSLREKNKFMIQKGYIGGGLINDRTGQGTQRIRQQQGIPGPQSGLIPSNAQVQAGRLRQGQPIAPTVVPAGINPTQRDRIKTEQETIRRQLPKRPGRRMV